MLLFFYFTTSLFLSIGCGKTTLIQFLCEKILDDELAVFRVHAGITNEMIIETMLDLQIKANQYLKSSERKRLWVFFDEFNTTSCIGLFKEIICERSLFGEPLPNNMIFLGACNPQRWRKPASILHENIGIKKDPYHIQQLCARLDGECLIYHVVPIPESMLEYAWDYGFLDGETEMNYIRAMLNKCANIKNAESWYDYAISLVAKSQQFFRTNEDISSISLRDVTRFCRFYNWLQNLPSEFMHEAGRPSNQEFIEQNTLVALLLTYYLRLSSSESRKLYLESIAEVLKTKFQNTHHIPTLLIRLLEKSEMNFIKKINLPPGTAINRALIDNIFVLFVCILNRIPVMLCGKPGSSKTLAVNIILNNLKGKRSDQKIFQTLPELVPCAYQGSQNCTSESVIKVFKRAERYLDLENNTDILPVIIFDEIGLAELSPHNPLKVLHSKLEMETCQYGFVGISNYSLDAAKMNRVLYFSCPDPTVDDLRLTATTIASSLRENSNQTIPIDNVFVTNLANAYFDLYQYINKNPKYKNDFGLRDFYYLIKGVVNDLIDASTKQNPYKIVRRQLAINFDGSFGGSQFLWERFCEYIHRDHLIELEQSLTFTQIIDQSLSLRNRRYLMLIGDNESAFDYMERYMNTKCKSIRTLIGSSLSDDSIASTTYSEQYTQRVLMDIILFAETSTTLIMRQMDHIYANLYDLFNQSFHISGNKKYCRIALGTGFHPRFLIHEDFFCIIFVRQQDLEKYDPALLNRFEKHIIDIESLIHPYHLTITSYLLDWIDKLLLHNSNKNFPQRKHLFVDFNPYSICNLVMDAFNHLQISENDYDYQKDTVIEYCKQQLIRTSSFDFPLYLSCKINNDDNLSNLTEQYYNIHNHLSFKSLIDEALDQNTITTRIIYTYTQIYEKIDYISNNKFFIEVKIGNVNNDFELRRIIREHYQSSNTRLLIIRVDYHEEYKHILFLKHLVANERIPASNHGVWLIFHLQRNIIHEVKDDVLFTGYTPIMIDNLNKHKLISWNTLSNPSYRNFLLHEGITLSDTNFNKLITQSFTRVRYTVTCKNKECFINNRYESIIELLTQSDVDTESLHSIIKNLLFELIRTVDINHTNSEFRDWRHDLFTKGELIGSCRSIDDALEMIILLYCCNYFLILLIEVEKSSVIDAYKFLKSKVNETVYEHLKCIWLDCLESILKSMELTVTCKNIVEIPVIFNLHLPRSRFEREIIRQINEIIKNPNENIDINLSDEGLLHFAIEKLRSSSAYGKNIEHILNNPDLFEYYYHDQLAILSDEMQIDYLTVPFALRLLTSNPRLSIEDKLKHLLIYQDELIELLHLFETGLGLIGEEKWNFDEYLCMSDKTHMKSIFNSRDSYILILIEETFYQIPPHQSFNDNPYECNGDPFIETCLMNLIELLVSSSSIQSVNDIAHLAAAFSLIIQAVLVLDHYSVNNLEKLRSLDSLIRCVMNLLPHDQALIVFKKICVSNPNNNFFDGNFSTCESIHVFTENLKQLIRYENQNSIDLSNCRPILKLEVEFLKNWLIDHSEEYCTVLESMGKSSKNLWFYSAKIFKYIEQKLDLMSTIQTHITELSSVSKVEHLDQYFRQSNDKTQKIKHILINRIHLYFRNHITNEDTIEKYLVDNHNYFLENICKVDSNCGLSMIISIAWFKVYADMYALALAKDDHTEIMELIDQTLVRAESRFSSTLKLYIIKKLCQILTIDLADLYEVFINRRCYWIQATFSQYDQQNKRKFEKDIIFPRPLFEACSQYTNIKNEWEKCKEINRLKSLISRCSDSIWSSYSLIMVFLNHYVNVYKRNVSNDNLETLFDDLHRELNTCFAPVGFKFCHNLCKNFQNNTYFQLSQTMPPDQLHRRLLALNIFAVFVASKAFRNSTYFSSILFNKDLQMPRDYAEHFKNLKCLPSFVLNTEIFSKKSCATTSEQDNDINDKPKHLNLSISFRFIRMMMNAVILVLFELDLLNDTNFPDRNYYREGFENDYKLVCQLSTEPQQCYIWLFKMINHMLHSTFLQHGSLNRVEKVIEFEQFIENKLIIPHIYSIIDEIQDYKLKYKESVQQIDHATPLMDLIDELVEDENQYPLLNFFNITNIQTVDPFEILRAKFRLVPNVDKLYPITTFLLQRYDDYTNIQHLYSIVTFTNYLIQKLNYRITRKNANKKTISEVLFNNSNKEEEKLYEKFIQAWYKLNFKEVHLGTQIIPFEHKYSSDDFAKGTKISALLLNSTGDKSNVLLIACLKTIAELQNDIVKYFHEIMNSNPINKKLQPYVVSLQTIKLKHLLCFDKNFLNDKLIDDASIINYDYGKGKDIIYDYEEIEFTLRDKVCSLPLIDTGRLQFLNYQFEFYDPNTSVITDVRRCIEQKLLNNNTERIKLQDLIKSFANDDILHCLGSLDYIFTYLRHFEYKNMSILTLKQFVEKHIHSKLCLSDNLLRDHMLSKIELQYVIDLYELIEEIVFEKILRNNIKQELPETLLFSDTKQNDLINQFIDMTSGKITISSRLKNLSCWINMLKRLIVRVSMNTNLSFDIPLHQYATRCDIWTVDVTTDDIESFKISDDILLRHAFIILKGLETRQNISLGYANRSTPTEPRIPRPPISSLTASGNKRKLRV